MAAGIFALIAILFFAYAAYRWCNGAPPLTNDQVQELVDEFIANERVGDFDRATEIFRNLSREGVTLRVTDDGVSWERR